MEEAGEDEGHSFHEVTVTGQDGTTRTVMVPVVQELSRLGLKFLPKRFIKVHNPIHDVKFTLPMSIPSISMARIQKWADPNVRAQELAQLASSAKEYGFILLCEHGIEHSIVHGVKQVVEGFFRLPLEEKRRSVGTYASFDNMGYGRNFVKSEDEALDWIDRLAMKAAPTKGVEEGQPHVWPQKPPNFREVVEKYVEQARKVCDHLLEALAEALSLSPHAFIQNFDPEMSEMKVRVNYYPPCPQPELAMGIAPHSDASGLTLLTQFGSAGGLQVLRGRSWATVPWRCEELLVNVGDLLEIMSDGRLKSPWHRVVAMEKERFSVALFYNPPSSAQIQPVGSEDGCYNKIVVGDYLRHFYKVSPTSAKEAIAYAKKA